MCPRSVLPIVLASVCLLATGSFADSWDRVSTIFEERCVVCHSGEGAPLGLSLSTHEGVMAGSESGPVVLPDAPESSPLYRRITGTAEPRMPLDGPPWLDPAQIDTILAWIATGAPGPEPGRVVDDPPPPAEAPYADGVVTYPEVERIFLQRCIECHSDNSKLGGPPEGLRLTSLADILAGGERIVVIPGNPQASEIIRRVEGLADPRMPLDGPPWLDEAEVQLLRDWIAGGALGEDGIPAPMPTGGEVRLRGILTAPDAIDGAAFVVTDGTRIDDRPSVGQQAEMRGRVGPDGTILAERLRDR